MRSAYAPEVCARRLIAAAFLCVGFMCCDLAQAQVSGPFGKFLAYELDSGLWDNDADSPRLVFEDVIEAQDAPWVRLAFERVQLGEGSFLRITSLFDGAVQDLDIPALEQWGYTSAFFNGPAVRVELFAGPFTVANSFAIKEIMVGTVPYGADTICGPSDDRTRSFVDAVARMLNTGLASGCTGTIYSPGACMVSAGHCSGLTVIQFNVPPSLPSGALQHPPPSDQYNMNVATLRSAAGGIGNDWAVFQCFDNTQTGLNVYEAQQDFIPVAASLPTLPANMVMYGHGSDSGVDNQVQQRSDGPIVGISGTVIEHRADSTGGSSGSAILYAATGEIIGIHTNGGCTSTGGANSGTNINNGGFQTNYPCALVAISFPDGLVTFVHPTNGATMRVLIEPAGDQPDPATARLFVEVVGGDDYTEIAMTPLGNDLYEAQFPPAPCDGTVNYYVGVTTVGGIFVTEPPDAPADHFTALVASGLATVFADSFESDLGWTVQNINLTTGAWVRVDPVGTTAQPEEDNPLGVGTMCYVTGQGVPGGGPGDADVDGGPTILTSPTFDLSAPGRYVLEYARWFYNDDGDDRLVVEVSEDDGASWVQVESFLGLGGWNTVQWDLDDFVTPTATVKVRFSTADNPNNSLTEAAVDDVRILLLDCAAACGDFDGDGDVDLTDFTAFQLCFGGSNNPPAPTCPPGVDADCDGDGDVDLADFLIFQNNFTGSL